VCVCVYFLLIVSPHSRTFLLNGRMCGGCAAPPWKPNAHSSRGLLLSLVLCEKKKDNNLCASAQHRHNQQRVSGKPTCRWYRRCGYELAMPYVHVLPLILRCALFSSLFPSSLSRPQLLYLTLDENVCPQTVFAWRTLQFPLACLLCMSFIS
jgi:hypothetical protein